VIVSDKNAKWIQPFSLEDYTATAADFVRRKLEDNSAGDADGNRSNIPSIIAAEMRLEFKSRKNKVKDQLGTGLVQVKRYARQHLSGRSRWGESLTAEKMKQCVWVEPKLTARIGFLERTEGGRLRHSRFVHLNEK
jgi:hypothetical protein